MERIFEGLIASIIAYFIVWIVSISHFSLFVSIPLLVVFLLLESIAIASIAEIIGSLIKDIFDFLFNL